MSISDRCICELCGSTFNSWSQEDICSVCSNGSDATIPGHKKNLDDAKKLREKARTVGLKALIGSPKQKLWGEVIRKQFLDSLAVSTTVAEEDVLSVYNILGSVRFKKATFWIEQRNDLKNLQLKLVKAVQLKCKANLMHANGCSESAEYHSIASEYHEIMDKF